MIIILFSLCIQVVFFSYLFALWLFNTSKLEVLQDYSDIIPKTASYELLEFEELEGNLSIEKEVPRLLEELNYSCVYFVHGTFVGDDPFDIISFIQNAFPSLSSTVVQSIRQGVKNGSNLIAREVGNFHPKLLERLQQHCPENIHFENFTWSSSNHHIARIRGAVKLMRSIAKNTSKSEKILLYGHSHAGQLFALISHLLSNDSLTIHLKDFLIKYEIEKEELEQLISQLKKRPMDFVTLGTPIRYPWSEKYLKNNMLLHFVNHRGKVPMGGSLSSSITTKSGDYIQQWAVAGSDSKVLVLEDKLRNEELDLILGIGSDVTSLRRNIKFKKRLHTRGHHFLVDFKDSSKIPNSFLTIFGHGVYTKRDQLLWIIYKSLTKIKRES
ncbi:hypothetical protein [Halobacteriovorax marinus]|uniref:hypothetical protein n=1 Tax=Halobacteriovorax marinus TaxID=97084 RepID=UPI003A920ED1